MRRSRFREVYEEPQVNLTPLIDVVFVILIMFIVVAPMLELDRIQLADAPQQGDNHSVQESSKIAIHVRKDNTVWYQGVRVTPEQLAQLLRKAHVTYPTIRPQLFHDREAHFGTYQAVKNAIEAAGFHEVDIVLKPS